MGHDVEESSDSASPKSILKKLWRHLVSNVSPHHLIPTSRAGHTDQYNLFPWSQKSHQAWHFIFLNMTVMEVWEVLPDIHRKIFESESDYVKRDWLNICTIEDENPDKLRLFLKDRDSFMDKKENIIKMQAMWERCFSGTSLQISIFVLRYMMLFMVFGEAMANPEKKIFVNGNLDELVQKVPQGGYRRWAFNQALGENASRHSIKAQISIILDKVGYS